MRKYGFIPYALLCAFLLSALSGCAAHTHAYRQTVIAPTCSSIGYTVNACSCGETFYSDYQAVTAHTFGDWVTEQTATLTVGGEEYRTCSVCGTLQTRDTENLSALLKLYLDDASNGTQLRISAGDGDRFTCDTRLTEHTDTGGGKPAYELELLSSAARAYFADFGWGEPDCYLLSPQNLDPTLSRTPAAQALWSACLALHLGEGTPEGQTAALELGGSVAVQVYRNGAYAGLYLLTPPQSGRLQTGGSTVAALRTEEESAGCLFRAAPTYRDARTENGTGGFAFIECSTASTEWATGSFSGFSEFVRRSRDTAFREQLSQYTDPELLFDYYLLLHVFGAPYGDTIGTVWFTADGVHWLPTFSDYQASYGLRSDGSLSNGADGIPTPDENGEILYTGKNLLWERLIGLFPAELSGRYHALRATVLQPDALYEAFLAQYARIEPELFEEEAALTPQHSGASDPERIRTYLQERIDAMDAWINALDASLADLQ